MYNHINTQVLTRNSLETIFSEPVCDYQKGLLRLALKDSDTTLNTFSFDSIMSVRYLTLMVEWRDASIEDTTCP